MTEQLPAVPRNEEYAKLFPVHTGWPTLGFLALYILGLVAVIAVTVFVIRWISMGDYK